MTTLHENAEHVKSLPTLPIYRYTAILKDGPATVKIARPNLEQLTEAVDKAVRGFGLHLVAVHSF